MGRWGTKSFDNDDALDWVYEVEETRSLGFLVNTLKVITHSQDYLEASDCSRAIAAAEVVAAIKGSASTETPDEIRAWIQKHSFRVSENQIKLALLAVAMIKTGSELSYQWHNTDEAESWMDGISRLEDQLRA